MQLHHAYCLLLCYVRKVIYGKAGLNRASIRAVLCYVRKVIYGKTRCTRTQSSTRLCYVRKVIYGKASVRERLTRRSCAMFVK